jgi:signal transduction histidine kinase
MSPSPPAAESAEDRRRVLKQAVRVEQIRLLYANAALAAGVTIVAASVLSYLQWKTILHPIVLAWLAYMIAISLVRFGLGQFYRYLADDLQNTRKWMVAFLIGTGLSGAGWGAAGIVLYPEAYLTNQVFLAFVLGGMMVGGASILAARIEAFALFILLSGLPTAVRMLLQADDVHLAMGLLAVLYTLATLITAWRVYLTILSSLELRFENHDLLASLRVSKNRAEALAAGLLTAQDEEHRRLSRELHDGLNQTIAILLIDAELLEHQLPSSSYQNSAQLRSLRSHITELSDDLRRIVYQLHPAVLEQVGLVAALESFCAEFSDREKISVRFRQRHIPGLIPPDIALCFYRVVQEGLRNVVKHSGARRAAIVLSGSARCIRLSVRDSGIGFQPEGRDIQGLGLLSLEERTRLVGGSFSVHSRLGKGTRIEVLIPFGAMEEASASPVSLLSWERSHPAHHQ